MSRTELAKLADTSPSAVSAYERAVRSPTVATLDRLLAACGLQLRPVLEPFLADLDAAVDELLCDPAPLPSCTSLMAALEEGGVSWAFDAGTALSLHGLSAQREGIEIVLAADDRTRRFLYPLGMRPVDVDGEIIWDGWLDLDLSRVAVATAWTRLGELTVRIVDVMPQPVLMSVEGATVPVLGLLDLEQQHSQLADVLARLRERRTV